MMRFHRRRILPRRRGPWTNTTALASMAALVVIVLIGALLHGTGDPADARALVDYAERDAQRPVDLVAALGRTHRLLVLGDVEGSASAKRVAAAAVRALALGPGLDALVLDVDSTAQPYIDAYLERSPRDASILLGHPSTLPGGSSDAYLAIYREVWELNRQLGADRSISIVAAAPAGWPPSGPLSPRRLAARLAGRGPGLVRRVETGILARLPRARVLAFVDGLQALRGGYGALAAGGGRPTPVRWMAELLERAHPGEVASILQDGEPEAASSPGVGYAGTAAYTIFRDASRPAVPFAVPVGNAFDFLPRPISVATSPGTQLTLGPLRYRLGDVADGYIDLGSH